MATDSGAPGHDRHPYVFLSYASSDRERALGIADLLEAQGVTVWLDRRSIAGGSSWSAEIVRGIRGCTALVVLCSPASMASENVQQEIQLAWESKRRILPLLLQPMEMLSNYGRKGVLRHFWCGDGEPLSVRRGKRPQEEDR